MNKTVSQLTVYFEDPFWVGVCERSCGENYEVCRIVFGAEPKDFQVYDLLVKHWSRMRFSSGIAVEEAQVPQTGRCSSAALAPRHSRRSNSSRNRAGRPEKSVPESSRRRKKNGSLRCMSRSDVKSIGGTEASVQ